MRQNYPAQSVAVVVPAFNAEATLGKCLAALAGQSLSAQQVIVVDDGSTDRTAQVAGSYGVTVVSSPRAGPAVARNTGARIAQADWLAFTDSDCIPDRYWLENLLTDETDCSLKAGAVFPAGDGEVEQYVKEISFRQSENVGARLPYAATANFLIHRELFWQVGGFDETFPIAGGEDSDLCWRLFWEGSKISFVPGATVIHHHALTLADLLVQRFRYGFGEQLLFEKYGGREDVGAMGVTSLSKQARTLVREISSALRVGGSTLARLQMEILSATAFFCGALSCKCRSLSADP